ncbi:DUF4124 domain-containing protein [Massilia sp. TWP1-3-3]|uniref:DUF4124 domain-containing protein n=1 Tax=Massilia sp. TWP1-3-3 TaxID=2804573 RepID=UPI003CF17549
MQASLLLALATLLAVQAPDTLADTMYKCVEASGNTAYSSRPCTGQAREAKQFAVPAPETEQASSARLTRERAQLRVADKQFRQRLAERNAREGGARTYGAHPVANTARGGQRQGGQAKPVQGKQSQDQLAKDTLAKERAEAARLNAARIGNCSMRRLEANCL